MWVSPLVHDAIHMLVCNSCAIHMYYLLYRFSLVYVKKKYIIQNKPHWSCHKLKNDSFSIQMRDWILHFHSR